MSRWGAFLQACLIRRKANMECGDWSSVASTDRSWFEAIRPDQAKQAASDLGVSAR
jgi:hypothetical protein